MNQRGVSPVVGMVLLVGLTSVVAVGMLTVGLAITDTTSSAAETQQVQSSMEQFADEADRVSDGDTTTETFTLSGSDSGTASVDPDAGRLEITHETESGNVPLYNDTFGAYRYQTDGTTFAYQGGGVWRDEDHGAPQMVTPPSFQYRAEPVPTLTFPIMRVTGTAIGNGAVEGELSAERRRAVYPSNASHTNPLEGGDVYIDIASDYCEGWESHIDDRTDGNVVESCDEVGNETRVGELRAKLSVPTGVEVNAAAIATDEISPDHGGAGQINGPVVIPDQDDIGRSLSHGSVTEYSYDLPDTETTQQLNRCTVFNGSPSTINSSGRYCIDDISTTDNDNLTITPENGDVTIVVENGINISDHKAKIHVRNNTGDNNRVTIYSGGDVVHQSDTPFGNPNDPSQTRLHTDSHVQFEGSEVEFYGLVLAPVEQPGENAAVEVKGDANVTGSVMSQTIFVQGSRSTIQWDPRMDAVGVGASNDNPIYYLHVSETELDVGS